jgi:hypothetical protein
VNTQTQTQFNVILKLLNPKPLPNLSTWSLNPKPVLKPNMTLALTPNITQRNMSALRCAHFFAGGAGGLQYLKTVLELWGGGGSNFDDLEIYDAGVMLLLRAGEEPSG